MGFLGEVLDYRWCVTFGGAATLLACHFLIGGRRQDVRKVYEAGRTHHVRTLCSVCF